MTSDAGALGAPRFDVVLRGYDRKQVDEHVARLQRVASRMRADLDMARSHPMLLVSPPGGIPASGGPRPAAQQPRPGHPQPGREGPDVVGNFTDRMQSILQAAEEEAAEIRTAAKRDAGAERESARRESESMRTELSELHRQRDAVVAELTRVRGQLEGMLAAPTARFAVTPQPVQSGASAKPGASGQAGASGKPGASGQAGASGKSGPAQPGGQRQSEKPEGPPRPSPRPKPSPEVRATGEETTAMPRPEAGDLFRPSSDGSNSPKREKPRATEPDRTMVVPSVQRSGDTGSDEKSPPAASNTPRDTPDTKSDKAGSRAHAEVSETVRVGVVHPAPSAPEPGSNGRNGRSGRSEEGRGGSGTDERGGQGVTEASGHADRSSSGSRSA